MLQDLVKKPSSRSHLMVVVSNLSSQQLVDLGTHLKSLSSRPIVTLVKNVPILGQQNVEEAKARVDLANAKHDLNFPASTDIIHGSNPQVTKDFFMKNGAFDAMIARGLNGQLSAWVKNFEAEDIKELTKQMLVTDVSGEIKISAASYRSLFTPNKPQPTHGLEHPPTVNNNNLSMGKTT